MPAWMRRRFSFIMRWVSLIDYFDQDMDDGFVKEVLDVLRYGLQKRGGRRMFKIIGQACAAGWAASLVLILLSGAVFAAPILNVAVPADPDSFDPTQTVAAATGEIAFNIYEGLVKASPSGGITGALAEKWTVDAGNTVYTFFYGMPSSMTVRPLPLPMWLMR